MVAPSTTPHRLRRRRRALTSLPLAGVAWVALTGLPFSPAPPTPGTMHTEVLELTGGDAIDTAAAGAAPDALRSAPTTAVPGWSATVDVDDDTQAIAASWLGAADGAVSVRGHSADGWTEWVSLAGEVEEAPDDAERTPGGMAWFGRDGVDEVEVKVTAGTLADLEVQTMRYEEPTGGAGSGLVAVAGAATSTAKPTIIPRSTWTTKGWVTKNSGCSSGPQTASGGVKYAVVHHTVNSNTYSEGDVPALMASIYAYHTGTNGWCDIGYNFVIDRFGRIWEGRSGGVEKAIAGGHAAGFNTGSVGVSYLGQFEPGASPSAAQPTSAALAAGAKLIGWKLSLNGIDPTGSTTVTSGGSNRYPSGTSVPIKRIIGHRDVGYTACPGANLYDDLAAMRTAAKAYQGTGTTTTTTPTTTPPTTTTTTPTAWTPFASPSQLVTQQYRDVLRREPSSSDLAYWTELVGSSWTPGRFVAHLTSSNEADSRVHAVTRLYQAYFLRTPDYGGLDYWLDRRAAGTGINTISNSFAASSEFSRRYGSLSNAGFVDLVYDNVLGRSPDAAGRSYWIDRLARGTSRGQVMANFSQSSEFTRKMADEANLVSLYASLLQRKPPADELTFFTAGLANGVTPLSSVATYLYDSSAYRSRFG
jgi:hypothetical protein